MNILIADNKYNLKHHLCEEIDGLRFTFLNSSKVSRHRLKSVDLAVINSDLIDVNKNYTGLSLIKKISSLSPHIEIISLINSSCQFKMEQSLAYGATKVLHMSVDFKELVSIIEKEICFKSLIKLTLNSPQIPWAGYGQIGLGILKQISKLKHEKGPILIEGPTGSGKEVAISLIEKMESPKKLIKVNIAAISPSLFESELFGHVKGAFTGADKCKTGLAQKADGGILFLDEIEALPLNLQVKLLRFLDSGEAKPVGSDISQKIKCKFIFATNKKLELLVREDKFREDLLWRISGKKVSLPPLRHRTEELKEIFEYYLKKFSKRVCCISDCGLKLLQNYSWPGNIRELIRVCEKIVIDAPLPIVRRVDLIPHLSSLSQNSTTSQNFQEIIKQFESKLIKNYYLKNNKNIEATSRDINVSRSNLYKKLKEYQIN